MWYADTVGLHRVYERICQFEQQHGAEWSPAPLLKKLDKSGEKFSDLDKDRSINRGLITEVE